MDFNDEILNAAAGLKTGAPSDGKTHGSIEPGLDLTNVHVDAFRHSAPSKGRSR